MGWARSWRPLEKLKLAENTIVVFYSDNGGYGPATDMAPLKGYKGTYYDGGDPRPILRQMARRRVKPGAKRGSESLFPTPCVP